MRQALLLSVVFWVITLPMLWDIVSADALNFRVCSKTTCAPAGEKAESMFSGAEGVISIASVAAISNSLECPDKCSNIDAAGKEIHVMGSHRDLMCQTWGGMFCIYKGANR